MELNRLESTTAVKIGGLRVYSYTRGYTRPDPTTGSTGNRYTRGSGRKFDLRVRVGLGNNLLATGRVVKTVYPQTPSRDPNMFRALYLENGWR